MDSVKETENQGSNYVATSTAMNSISLTDSVIPPEATPEESKSPISSVSEVEQIVCTDGDPVNDSKSTKDAEGTKRGADDEVENETKRYRLKRRKIKAAGAPKMPLTGYVRYMAARREQLRTELPEKTSMEYTKIIGEEWSAMAEDKKTPYLKEAEVDRQRYIKELNNFLKDRPDILASELAKNKIRKRKENLATKSVLTEKVQANGTTGNGGPPIKTSPNNSNEIISMVPMKNSKLLQTSQTTQTNANLNRRFGQQGSGFYESGGIPIFTEEFLEHNKCVDMELRTLRKSNVDFEQQNAVLEKHVENMKTGVEKMITENDELQEKNRLLESYLDKLKLKLAQALSGLAIPTEPNGATLDNIDKYMSDLYKMTTSNTHGPASLNKAKDIIRKLDLTIQL